MKVPLVRSLLLPVLACASLTAGCSSDDNQQKPDPKPTQEAPPTADGLVGRDDFNRIAAEFYLPLFWKADEDGDGFIEASEVVVLWGYPGADTDASTWIGHQPGANGKAVFTDKFINALDAVQGVYAGGHYPHGLPVEQTRREAMRKELAQGRPTLVLTDVREAPEQDREVIRHLLDAALLIEGLFAQQTGTLQFADQLAPDDNEGRMVLFRNQGPWCASPQMEADPACHALPGGPAQRPPKVSGLYPADLQQHADFCDLLAARPDADALMDPFTVVEGLGSGEVKAVPYTVAYRQGMEAVALTLERAAASITDPHEDAFKSYLLADAQAFRDNDWEKADEAWAKMSSENSRFYLRLAPDEVYFDPCSRKAGFHASFAYINPGSVEWRRKLEPVKLEMEQAMAALAGPPYAARHVAFDLPDFIDIIVNAGDARRPYGATVGQSLPNWGKVADAGGRTVVMTNVYTDADSLEAITEQTRSVLCADTFSRFDVDPELQVMSTVLHEAAHNLGPSHEYAVDGKVDDEVFGGPLASMLEELKAQTAALYFTTWLAKKQIITSEVAHASHLRDLVWAFGKISEGMTSADGQAKPYPQLCAIQLGFLIEQGAVSWRADESSVGGDRGCIAMDAAKSEVAIDELAKVVLRIKGSGDVAGAKALKQRLVDDDGALKNIRAQITERWLRTKKATFVYSIRM